MARLNIRDFPDDLHHQLLQAAAKHERSLEGEARFGLARYVESLQVPKPIATSLCESWQRSTGQRLHKLFARLREDNVFASSEPPHLAMALKESSPETLMNCIDGRTPLPFDLARRIAAHCGCSLDWLISGSGSMFPYPEVGGDYRDFFAPATTGSGITIKLVRLCSNGEGSDPGAHDGTLLMLRCKDDSSSIEAGYCGRFYLNDLMGAGSDISLNGFVSFLNESQNLHYSEHNSFAPIGASAISDHHPKYYLDFKHCSKASWLYPLRARVSTSNINWTQKHGFMAPKEIPAVTPGV